MTMLIDCGGKTDRLCQQTTNQPIQTREGLITPQKKI